jgi:hypothetical protein
MASSEMDELQNTNASSGKLDESPDKELSLVGLQPKPPRTVSGLAWIAVVVSVLSSVFLFSLDNTITADIQPAIVNRFDAVDRLAWIAVAYFLGAAALTLSWYASPL